MSTPALSRHSLHVRSAGDAQVHHPSTQTSETLLAAAMWVLGVSATQGRYLDAAFGSLRITLSLGIVFGTLGWWRGVTDPILRKYLRFACPFFLVGVLSLVAAPARSPLSARDFGSFDEQGAKLLWFLLIPGIAVILQNPRLFRALVRGLIFGASIFLIVAMRRALTDEPALVNEILLGTHRGTIDIIVVWLLPIVLRASFIGLRQWTRYAYVAGTIVWIVTSRGRGGMLAMLLCPLAFYMLKPSKSGKPVGPRIAAAGIAGFAIFLTLSNVTIPFAPSLSRLAQAQSGNRTDSDEIRILLLKKAYALTWKHPLTGVGMGKVGGAYDPIIEHARNEHVRTDSLELPTHNIYVEMFAATGVLGGLLFLGIVTAPLALAIRYCANYQLRLIAAGFCAVIFTMFFSAFFEAILFMSSAVMLAAAVGTVSNPRFLDEFP